MPHPMTEFEPEHKVNEGNNTQFPTMRASIGQDVVCL